VAELGIRGQENLEKAKSPAVIGGKLSWHRPGKPEVSGFGPR
jgi:hypothetical protein